MHVLAFTGMPGSGKSVAVETVRARGIPVVRMGDFIMEEVARRGLPPTEEHIGPVATGLRDEQGAEVWARRTVEAIQTGSVPGVAEDTALIAIDGVRSLAELEHFRQTMGQEFHLIAIECPEEVRHERLMSRGRSDDQGAEDWVRDRDDRERGWGVEEAIERADHKIDNDSDVETLKGRITALLDEILAPA